jgi:FkbM family methyltransferase
MGWSDSILKWVDSSFCRSALRMANRLLWLPRPMPVRLFGNKIYAASCDRLLALLLAKFGRAEGYEIDLWTSMLRPGMVVADIGANLGLYTLLASRCVGPTGRVYSFEPDPNNFALLKRSVEANDCTNVVLHQAAVSNEIGTLCLHRSEEHHGDHRIYACGKGERPTIRVPVTTLDAVLASGIRLDAVKIDVQGSEWRVLQGMRQVITLNPALAVVLEFWPRGLGEAGSGAAAFLRQLRNLGLKVRNINNAHAVLEELGDEDLIATAERHGYTNLLAEGPDRARICGSAGRLLGGVPPG